MSEEKQTKEKIPSQEFIESIKSWVSVDDKIKKLKDEIKNLTSEKKEFEIEILEGLDKLEENVISITDGKIKKNISKTQTPLKKDLIHKSILNFIKDESKTLQIIENMNNSRQTVERINLKRIKNRTPKIPNTEIFEKVI
jgi:hypothetical protein